MSWVVIYDTDVHGGVSGLIAVKSLMEVGEDILRHYSHFERVQPNTEPQLPVTSPQFLAKSLPRVIVPGKANLVILDIPVDVMNPLEFINTLASYRIRNRVLYFDHHGHSESYTRELFERGIETYISSSSYEMSLMLPRVLGVSQDILKELETWALIGALSDFDVTITNKVTRSLEEQVLEYLDTFWKMHWNRYIQLNPEHGSVGSIIQFIIDNNFAPQEFLEWVQDKSSSIQIPEYRAIGDVSLIESELPPGLAWKSCWKVNMIVGTKVCVTRTRTPRGISVIVASYWRNPEVFQVVDEIVEIVSRGRSVVGHTGAKSILVNTLEEAEGLINEIVRMLNERIATFYVPRSVRLISESKVSEALYRDFSEILRRLGDILEEQRKLYREYLNLKRKQVELLEESSGEDRRRYD